MRARVQVSESVSESVHESVSERVSDSVRICRGDAGVV